MLTTLEALDLSNGEIFNEILARGAAGLLKSMPKATADELADNDLPPALGHGQRPANWRRHATLSARHRRAEGLADLLWVVFVLPEFQLIR